MARRKKTKLPEKLYIREPDGEYDERIPMEEYELQDTCNGDSPTKYGEYVLQRMVNVETKVVIEDA